MNVKDKIFSRVFEPRFNRVLELGPWIGHDTLLLARAAREVVAVESRSENIERIRAGLEFLTDPAPHPNGGLAVQFQAYKPQG